MEIEDEFATCPYDSRHRVPRLRIQYHIVKCAPKHPQLGICPYNATHRLPIQNLQAHVTTCPSKEKIFPDERRSQVVASLTKPKPILQEDYLPETDPNHEMWDDLPQ